MERLDFQTALIESLEVEGISQSELGRRAKVTQQTISNYIDNKVDNPRTKQKKLITKALGFSSLRAMIAYGREKRTGEIINNGGDESMKERLRHCEQRIKDLEKIIELYESGNANP